MEITVSITGDNNYVFHMGEEVLHSYKKEIEHLLRIIKEKDKIIEEKERLIQVLMSKKE